MKKISDIHMLLKEMMMGYKINFRVSKLASVTLLMLVSCSSNEINTPKKITALLGCEATDAYNDILYSLEGIKELAKENNIMIYMDNSSKNRCGYLFAWRSEKYIAGALTDYDLGSAMEVFFELP